MNFAFNLYNAHYYYPPPATRFSVWGFGRFLL
jgi:hypothetical protein